MTADLVYQLQTLGRAESERVLPLYKAVVRLNAQDFRVFREDGRWVMTCTPQPQDCGPQS